MNLIDSRVGSQDLGNGNVVPFRSGRYADFDFSESLGQYYELVKQGNVFCASRVAGAVWGTALTATAITLTLHNPIASTVDLVVLMATFQMTADQTTTTNAPTVLYAANLDNSEAAVTGTALIVKNAYLFTKAGQGLAYSAATLPSTPIAIRVFPWGHVCQTSGTVIQKSQAPAVDYVDGAIVLRPNTSVTLQGLATTTQITGIASIVWAEIPT